MEFLLGAMLDPLHPQEGIKRHEFGVAFDYAQDRVGHLAVQGFLRHAPWNRKFRESCKAVHAFVDEFVRRAQTEQETQSAVGKDQMEKSGRYVFLDELVRSTNDPDRIRDELVNILIAGRDTTAALLTHTFHAISKRPDIWAKLREDVQSLKGLPPSYEDLKSMKYLKQVIDESKQPQMCHCLRQTKANQILPALQQAFVSIQSSLRTRVSQTRTPASPMAAAQMALRQCSSLQDRWSVTTSTPCTEIQQSTARTPRSSSRNAGTP